MPKKIQILTNWVTIGTSGPTIDGREIPEEVLQQAADNYDPEEYEAVINSDHMLSWYGNFGTVSELRTQTDKKKRTVLQARLAPNKRLMQMNKEGQRMYTSMELASDFAGTGKGYLVGLAVTDQPASLGTTPLHFNKEAKPTNLVGQFTEFSLNQNSPDQNNPAADAAAMEGFFKRLFNFLNQPADFAGADQPDENEPMDKAQFEKMTEGFSGIQKSVEELTKALAPKADDTPAPTGDEPTDDYAALKKKVEELEAKVASYSKPEGDDTQAAAGEEAVGAEQFAQLSKQMEGLMTQFKALSQESPGTQIPAGTGAGQEAAFV